MQGLLPWAFFLGVVILGITDAQSIEKRSPQYSIETRVIIDAHAFNSWKTKMSASDAATKTALQNYVKAAFNDMNSIFGVLSKSGINMDARIVSIEFVNEKITSSSAGTVDADQALTEFSRWLSSKSYPRADHTMLFTGLDLTKHGEKTPAGVANLGMMCDTESSLSVVEATPSGSVTITMAHELGHSLGADHDDVHQECSSGNYVMKATSNAEKASNQNFRFSACSTKYFKDFLASGKGSCLTQTSVQKQTATSLGKLYTPDQMCQMVAGKTSYLCRNFFGTGGTAYSSICVSMMCQEAGSDRCMSVKPADGFVCGKGKSCFLGDCVEDSSLSTGSATDTCPLGDVPLPMSYLDNQKCEQAISSFSGHCYHDGIRRSCCRSCEAVKTSDQNCVYGDKASWCSNLQSYYCYSNHESCCATCNKFDTGIEGCKYGDHHPDCSTLASYSCYGNDAACCARCKQFEKPNLGADCKYGDQADWCASMSRQHCPMNSQACCEKCQ